ncbi:hypothetical protein CDL12_15006 [Handroanthus impetiginosus]|uniref:Uncharacterized protein n=1 Tax=Handroanthus impetiginosus TaxID=429701 RepID=A0A2G9H4Z3_9LAMI|nr:hypothetical protein CDL12_15006 [Handroanthus impetiginosus]
MEFLNSTISVNLQNSPAVPFLTWKSRKNPSRLIIPSSRKLHLPPSLSVYLFRPISSKKFQISAHFSRRSNRQNYLRKKLIQQQQQQQEVSHLQKPLRQIDKGDIYESNFDGSGESSKNVDGSSILDNELKFYSEGSEMELRKTEISDSMMWNKLESWVEQYKKDSEFWGIGTGPIFTVFQDSEGKVQRVVVNEDEILRRCRIDPRLDNDNEDLAEVNFKVSLAKDLAKEIENGSSVIPKNSSVAKFLTLGGKSRFIEAIQSVKLKPALFSKMSRVGVLVLCGLSVVWAVRGLLLGRGDSEDYTRLEKEMLRRKIKARKEEEKIVEGNVEVMQKPIEPETVSFKRPRLDKEGLLNGIIKAKGSNSELAMMEYSGYQNEEYNDKIEEIRAMARHAREVEQRDSLPDDGDGEDYQALEEYSSNNNELYARDSDETTESMSSAESKDDIGESTDEALVEKSETKSCNIPNVVIPSDTESSRPEVSNVKVVLESSDLNEANLHSDGPGSQSGPHENSSRKKLRIIKSAKEAREYLSRKYHLPKVDPKHEVKNDELTDIAITMPSTNVASVSTEQTLDLTDEVYDSSALSGSKDVSHSSEDYSGNSGTAEGNVDVLNDLEKSRISSGREVSVSNGDAEISVFEIPRQKETNIKTSQDNDCRNEISSSLGSMPDSTSTADDRGGSVQTEEVPTPLNKRNSEDTERNEIMEGLQLNGTAAASEVNDRDLAPTVRKENWIERNFHEFEPIVKKIGDGFRDNYYVAREKASEELVAETELTQLKSDGNEYEFEWMKDERLREIVFRVRDNELSGRDPFHLMDEEDKRAFFSGLEKRVEEENQKLLKLHEYFHSNIENLDYGADGISIYDPPEKITPRWKVPPAEKNPPVLNNFLEQRKTLFPEGLKNSSLSRKTGKDSINKPEELSSRKNSPVAADVSAASTGHRENTSISSKTIIQGSDGSVRAGKKSGKEYWEHTKKWSQGFLDCYNAESDPEVKAIMRDIGKDLDRWITEKEIQEAAELMEMDSIPQKRKMFIKQKLDKLKREVELFGPQAVASKYREYSDEKEEDYLWWLDLPFVLCIEIYTTENGEQRVGFYSLEMAADLELDPKQYHVIAFEDAGDSKKFCYIIQTHMEMLGNGNAFVVPRPPKDAFYDAKANGFSVTVIRKGQLKLNIDQTLEEVEESIVEIGSKIYHDKIMKDRAADMSGLMKGVFGFKEPPKRQTSKPKSKGRIKP